MAPGAFVVCLGFALSGPAFGQCQGLGTAKTARLVKVGDRLDIALDGGRVVAFPSLEPPRASSSAPNRPAEVAAELTSLLADRDLRVESLGPPDRWGRTPVRLFVAADRGQKAIMADESADVTLASAGLALASRDGGPCALAVRAAERQARQDNLGIWADPAFAVLAAGRTAKFSERAGTLALVEGEIRSIGRTAPRLYLNFGSGRGDFSATIARRNLPLFEKAGFSAEVLAHKLVRLRGIIEMTPAPQIELFHSDQIEIIDLKPSTGEAAGARN
jgi:endonuclease YncB( thermonuclease family)